MKWALGVITWLIYAIGIAAAPNSAVTLIPEFNQIRPNQSFRIGVQVSLPKGWHTYSNQPGETGLPTTLNWELPSHTRITGTQWKKSHPFSFAGTTANGYKDSAIIVADLHTTHSTHTEIPISLTVKWLICKIECIPMSQTLSISIPTAASSQQNPKWIPWYSEIEADLQLPASASPSQSTVLTNLGILALAFLGGLLLNIMPCVLPVISIKILGFIKHGHDDHHSPLVHGALFSLGILSSFWGFALILNIMRNLGQLAGWGFQLQHPATIVTLAYLFGFIVLNFWGMFEFTLPVTRLSEVEHRAQGLLKPFSGGVLAGVVASPCTAPFMGAAIGATLTQSAGWTFATFTTLGVGMAFPYILLTAFPKWLKSLPHPGPWMNTLKKLLSIPLVASIIWLLWVLSAQTNITAISIWTGSILVIAALFRWRNTIELNSKVRRLSILSLIGVIIIGVIWITQNATPPKTKVPPNWIAYSTELVSQLDAQRRPYFIDFTARWCLTCQTNKRVLTHPKIQALFDQKKVVQIYADWTTHDESITRALERYGRTGIPVYILYSGSGAPQQLPEILTVSSLSDALRSLP